MNNKTNAHQKQHFERHFTGYLLKPAIALMFAILLLGSSRAKASGIDTNWVKVADTAGVAVYYQVTTCSGDNAVFINFSNSNSY